MRVGRRKRSGLTSKPFLLEDTGRKKLFVGTQKEIEVFLLSNSFIQLIWVKFYKCLQVLAINMDLSNTNL